MTSEDPVLLQPVTESSGPVEVKMTYSVNWVKVDGSFKHRFHRYLDFGFFEHQIHWFSLFNSFMMVIFLVGLVSLILMRALRRDYERFDDGDIDEIPEINGVIDETGWKQVHSEVFRAPENLPLFSALIGTGYQLLFSLLLVILAAIFNRLYDSRGSITTISIIVFALNSVVAGYVSATTFLEYSSKSDPNWKLVTFHTALLFPGLIVGVLGTLNVLSWVYKATTTVSFFTSVAVFCIFCVQLVLLVVGTQIGRKTFKGSDFPSQNRVIRPIPDTEWYMQRWFICLLGGTLPFGSIFIEMYFIFTSFWNYKFYYVYGFSLLVLAILLVVTVCVSIVSTYFLLNAEDHRWKWSSIMSGGSTAFYVFIYSVFYFYTKTSMSGLFQTAFYFGYMLIFSAALFFLGSAVAYSGTRKFVLTIYENIKSD